MTEQIEKRNCKECLHFEACCKWTDFPKQLGFPVCRKYRKQEWISVEERLPENIGSYLVVVKLKYPWEKEWEYDVDVAEYNPLENGYIDHWNTWNDWNEGQECHITHWMPLPEPPKKGGAE